MYGITGGAAVGAIRTLNTSRSYSNCIKYHVFWLNLTPAIRSASHWGIGTFMFISAASWYVTFDAFFTLLISNATISVPGLYVEPRERENEGQ